MHCSADENRCLRHTLCRSIPNSPRSCAAALPQPAASTARGRRALVITPSRVFAHQCVYIHHGRSKYRHYLNLKDS
eukprot:6210298-Pleurochrysis_carterae.AAC.1